eukprot:m.233634 g.233634  ORF g.233634 m.233634 type:complete len:67 (+) comp40093_c0_seq3:33-233(+)
MCKKLRCHVTYSRQKLASLAMWTNRCFQRRCSTRSTVEEAFLARLLCDFMVADAKKMTKKLFDYEI